MFNQIDIELLKKLIIYEYDTGKVFWKERSVKDFNMENKDLKTWNSKFAGKEIKSIKEGYYSFRYQTKDIKFRTGLHRVIFAYHHGYWPSVIIDHKDGNKINNRIDNLILSTISENAKNSKPKSESGYKNIRWEPRTKKWAVRFRISKGKDISGGNYKNISEAISVRDKLFLLYNHPPARDNPNWDYIREKEGN